MSSCPSGKQLASLLSDALSAAERDSLARHVETCRSCQAELAHQTEAPAAEMWRRTGLPPQFSGAEDEMVRRLKQMAPLLMPTLPEATAWPADHSSPTVIRRPGPAGADRPVVPGYEILG